MVSSLGAHRGEILGNSRGATSGAPKSSSGDLRESPLDLLWRVPSRGAYNSSLEAPKMHNLRIPEKLTIRSNHLELPYSSNYLP